MSSKRYAGRSGGGECPAKGEKPMLLLRGGDVFSPQPLGRQDLLLGGGRILALDQRIEPPREYFPRLEVLDLTGRTVIPGLIDQHCHLAGGGGEGGFQNRTPPVPFPTLVEAGITTVVGLLGTDGVTRSVQEVLAGARRLQALGLSAYIYTGAYQLPTRTLTGSIRSDLILIPEVLGTGEIAIADDRSSHPRERDLLAVASEARVGGLLAGKAGVVHLHVGDSDRGLRSVLRLLRSHTVPASLFVATHLNRRPELLEEAVTLARLGARPDLTTTIGADPGDRGTVSASRALSELLRAGLGAEVVTLSSDGGGSDPRFDAAGNLTSLGVGSPASLWSEARRALREEGLDLPEVLPAVTANVADTLGLKQKGRLRQGADADLIVLGPELEIDLVVAGGRLLVQGGRSLVREPFSDG